MSKRETILRYTLIIKKLRERPSTFSEISDYLNLQSDIQGYNFDISKRTFHRDMEDIGSIYNMDIKYDFSRKVYFIDMDQQPDVYDRIFEAFDIFHALNTSKQLGSFIHFEQKGSKGTENLYNLLLSIKNDMQIKFLYQKFGESTSTLRTVEPHALKEFKNRWYLLAKDLKDNKIKVFALDRISNPQSSKVKFHRPADFDVNNYFKHCFGIIKLNSNSPEEIILSFNPFQGQYIKTLPLHESQTIILENEQELSVKLNLCITLDFIMEILSYGENVRVIKPITLQKRIIESLNQMSKLYSL